MLLPVTRFVFLFGEHSERDSGKIAREERPAFQSERILQRVETRFRRPSWLLNCEKSIKISREGKETVKSGCSFIVCEAIRLTWNNLVEWKSVIRERRSQWISSQGLPSIVVNARDFLLLSMKKQPECVLVNVMLTEAEIKSRVEWVSPRPQFYLPSRF